MTAAVRRKRGRKSAAELAVPAALIEALPRPDPPDGESLTDEETALWWAVINQLPAEHAPPEAHALLAAYCRHIVSARRHSDFGQSRRRSLPKSPRAARLRLKPPTIARALSASCSACAMGKYALPAHWQRAYG
jgi:hypothetical protein